MNNAQKSKYATRYIILFIALFAGLIGLVLLNSVTYKYDITIKHVKYQVDSVVYHPIGGDNTLQVSPYWKAHLKGVNLFITTYQHVTVGDSIQVIEKTLVEKKGARIEKN